MEYKKYTDFMVYSVTKIKNGYGFRVVLRFADGTERTQQHAGFRTKREANQKRDEAIGKLHGREYIVYEKETVADFMDHWLESVMRKKIADNTYNAYRNAIRNYIIPEMGTLHLSTVNQGHVRKLYNAAAAKRVSVTHIVKTVMNTSLDYAAKNSLIPANPARNVALPKSVKRRSTANGKLTRKRRLLCRRS